jgi:type IV secretory pathway TrbF-like protein
MDRLNGVLEAVPLVAGLGHVRYVNLRGSLSSTPATYQVDWANELHPTGRGFEAVARRFNAVLTQL